MLKDIVDPIVEGIYVSIIKEINLEGKAEWFVYLVNSTKIDVENVIISSQGYGNINEEKVKTSTLRHYFETIAAESYTKIEPIVNEVFGLTNEYWVSYYIGRTIYDKKFIFLPESITEQNFTEIPILKKKGVLIK